MIGKKTNKIVPSSTSIRKSSRFPNKFNLYYKRLLIGTLSFRANKWVFAYSQEFKEQDRIATLFPFPDKNAIYRSENLWPFFESRIPSKERIESDSYFGNPVFIHEPVLHKRQALLLKAFGERTITNPFVLKVF
jgi:hypothetical protein